MEVKLHIESKCYFTCIVLQYYPGCIVNAYNNNNNKIFLLKGGARYLWYQLGTTINKKEKKKYNQT